MNLFEGILDVVFPPKCVLCGSLLKQGETDLCRACRVDAPEYRGGKSTPQFLDSFTAVWYYEGNVRKSLLRYKFGGARHYAKSYGRLLAMKAAQRHPEGFEVVTWVPVSPLRNLRRGYDQVQLLGKALGRELDVKPVRLIRKIRHNPAQSGIRESARRRENVRGVYRVLPGREVQGKRILLLDDILTTGATAGEAARVLKEAGAKEVHCAVIAAARKE